jgi:hypothetical protein
MVRERSRGGRGGAVAAPWRGRCPTSRRHLQQGRRWGRVKVRDHGLIIIIKDETAVGNVFGGPLTGQATFLTKREVIDLATGTGSFRMDMQITRADGVVIDTVLEGLTTGVTPTATMVNVSGTWRIKHDSDGDAKLKGERTFFGQENFETGETQGNFSGAVQ